ncbi:MAG TPA: hypothetical protein VED01_09290 [Burkholderiales bacterium]|nr:hypothetical protein [Burkholderiales bacterium]
MKDTLDAWLAHTPDTAAANLLERSSDEVVREILEHYNKVYPEERTVIRVRDRQGRFSKIDVTELDEPERPILERYQVIQERDVAPLVPDELREDEFVAFFRNSEESWRPYAAGLPWTRSGRPAAILKSILRRLDAGGPDENCVAYISSESGAGGTTLARSLAWECAREGYPTLVAKSVPFTPDALSVSNFLQRVHANAQPLSPRGRDSSSPLEPTESTGTQHPVRYETPSIIVFDQLHWHYRDSELVQFRNELQREGRPVCILVVAGPVLGLSFFNKSVFKHLVDLNHALQEDEAQALGRHLNRFLRVYGKERNDHEWTAFYREHTVRYLEGVAAFWVTLSFWMQRQYDLSESVQEWMYRCFKENTNDDEVKHAVLEIAALSTERLPLPQQLLPASKGKWPIAHLLEDLRSSLGALGLVRVQTDGEKHWALVHDVLGRFLINALFYDFESRSALGFAEAKDAEHLRFMLLRQIAHKSMLGERAYQTIGEDFATSIFKIDPDHGHGSFASIWPEVLDALDNMPQSLRDTNRVFRHHTAVSRRRIARLDERFYGVTNALRIALLLRAIEDINYALSFIEYSPGSEPNLNLFNSLANAYLDLAEAEAVEGAPRPRILELRKLASEATHKAYVESPTNSFVLETYVKNLLESARDPGELAIEHCIEALGLVFSALISDEATYRKSQLGALADQGLAILLQQTPPDIEDAEPRREVDVLIAAWKVLAKEGNYQIGRGLSAVPEENRVRALQLLGHPLGRGNMQVLRLRYDLLSLTSPFSFKQQLELVEQLQATKYRVTPQLRLEYAILLFQNQRSVEGDKVFRFLRQLWRESEHFVQVPERLRWLRDMNDSTLRTVQALASADFENRALARVQDFGNTLVPYRPEEHGFRDPKPGYRFACHVSFGHNGPFLRPPTAGPAKKSV